MSKSTLQFSYIFKVDLVYINLEFTTNKKDGGMSWSFYMILCEKYTLIICSKTAGIILSWSCSHFLEWENISGVRSFEFYVMFTTAVFYWI